MVSYTFYTFKKLKATKKRIGTRKLVPEEKITTFLLLHGTGWNEEDLVPLAYEIDKGAAILSPRGKVLENVYDLMDEVQKAKVGCYHCTLSDHSHSSFI